MTIEDFAAGWGSVPTAVIADVSNGACLIDSKIRPLLPPGLQSRMMGRAVTALCSPPDFGSVLRALEQVGKGDVLVIDAQANGEHAMIGDVLGGFLRARGCAGIVCDGAVRDAGTIAQWKDLPVFCRSITPRGPTAFSGSDVNVPVLIGGVRVQAGDLIVGDDDGVCAIGTSLLEIVLEKAQQKLKLEEIWQESLAAGKSVAETFGLKS